MASNMGCETLFPAGNPNANSDFVGTDASPLKARLGPLSIAHGPIPTHAPSTAPLSPLIDRGSCPGVATDQRGYGNSMTQWRPGDFAGAPNPPGGDQCDMGAVEAGAVVNDWYVFSDGFETGGTLGLRGSSPRLHRGCPFTALSPLPGRPRSVEQSYRREPRQ